MSGVRAVGSGCLQLLAEVLSLREEIWWPELREGLVSVLPYIEVRRGTFKTLPRGQEWTGGPGLFSVQNIAAIPQMDHIRNYF